MKDDRNPIQKILDHPNFKELAETALQTYREAAINKLEAEKLAGDRVSTLKVLNRAVRGLCNANAYMHDMFVHHSDGSAPPRPAETSKENDEHDEHTEMVLKAMDLAEYAKQLEKHVMKLSGLLGLPDEPFEDLLVRISKIPSVDAEFPSRHQLPDGSYTNSTGDALMAWYTAANTGDWKKAEAKGKARREAAMKQARDPEQQNNASIEALDESLSKLDPEKHVDSDGYSKHDEGWGG